MNVVSLWKLIPAPRVGREGHEWRFSEFPPEVMALLDTFAEDMICDIAAGRRQPFLCGDLLAVRTEHHRRQQ